MTDEERESLRLIAYRLGLVEDDIKSIKDDTKQVGQILGKLRLDEEVLRSLKTQADKLEHNQRVTDNKQDARIKELEDVVVPNHGMWTEAADNLKKFQMKITLALLGSVGSIGGIVAWLK